MLAWLPRSAAADEPGLSIETGSPDALCPDLATTRAAVERRLGQLVVPDGNAFTARYTMAHAPAGNVRDFVRLELFGPDHAVLLSRDLPLDGESCSTMADVIALVLDRHFRALLGREPVADPAPAGSSSAAVAPDVAPGASAERGAPAAPSEVPAGAADPAPASPRPPQLDSAANAASAPLDVAPGEAVADDGSSGAGSVSLELAFREPDHPALGGRALFAAWPEGLVGAALHMGLTQDHETVAGGEAKSRELIARGFLAWAPRLGSARPYVGPGLRLNVAHGTGRGLTTSQSGYRMSPSFGADAGVIWRADARWLLSASAAVDVMVPRMGGWFSVDDAEVLEPAPVRLWLGVGVGYAL